MNHLPFRTSAIMIVLGVLAGAAVYAYIIAVAYLAKWVGV